MKKPETLVNEYVRRLSDDDLRQISTKLSQHVAGDRAECALIFERDREVNRWLQSASGADDWFDMVDSIGEAASDELDRRIASRKKEKENKRRERS